MIKHPILWDLYALDWMTNNRSPAIESYSRDVTACLARDEWFQTLPQVGLSLSISWSGSLEYGVLKDKRKFKTTEHLLL